MNLDEVRELQKKLMAVIDTEVARVLTGDSIGAYPAVGDAFPTPIGVGTVTHVEDGKIFVSVPPDMSKLDITFSVELSPPKPPCCIDATCEVCQREDEEPWA
jgi:hypothetical protein